MFLIHRLAAPERHYPTGARPACKDRRVTPAPGGIALARSYFTELVAPTIRRHVPELRYAAARLGSGSEVLGLDDEISRDHDWGLRLQLFVADTDVTRLRSTLEDHLPTEFDGHPVRFGFSSDPAARLRIDVDSVDSATKQHLGFDPRRDASVQDWLSLSGQAVLEITAGEVFRDAVGDLTSLREALAWYPDDVWRYVIACDWQRIDQELPLMQRAGHRGDDLGSRVIAARLVDVTMHLGFLLCRQWVPYPKWRGTLFNRLPLHINVATALSETLTADGWEDRAAHLADALDALADHQGQLGIPTSSPTIAPFHDRPYRHIDHGMVPRLLESIRDSDVRALPPGLGSVEQRSDNVDLLTSARHRRAALT